MSTPATAFSEREYMVIKVARGVESGANYWVAGGGGPLYAVLLARELGLADAQYITEDGVVAPEPSLPFQAMGSMMSSRAAHRASHWGTMNTAGDHAQLGFMDYGILSTLQVDQFGNINSTILGGSYDEWGRRFGGPGGAQTIAAQCWRTILMTDQQKRKFVERVDFISSPGFLDGSEGARERAGLPAGTGPWRVYTPWATYDYEDRRLRLIKRSPWVTVDEILAECDFTPRIAPEVAVSEPPTEEELDVYRTRLDVRGQTMDRGIWVLRDDDGSYRRQEAGA